MIVDDFHHRLSRVERNLARKNVAPTFPKYDLPLNVFRPFVFYCDLGANPYIGSPDMGFAWGSNDINPDGFDETYLMAPFGHIAGGGPNYTTGPAYSDPVYYMNIGSWHHITITQTYEGTGSDVSGIYYKWLTEYYVDGDLSMSWHHRWRDLFTGVRICSFYRGNYYLDNIVLIANGVHHDLNPDSHNLGEWINNSGTWHFDSKTFSDRTVITPVPVSLDASDDYLLVTFPDATNIILEYDVYGRPGYNTT